MLFTIWFPELLTAFAQKQWLSARYSVTEFVRLGHDGWTMRHAFYADMGGILLEGPDYPAFPVNAHQIAYLLKHEYIESPQIDSQVIWDKNKADGFARLVASIQVLWFTAQCLGRAAAKLPLSTIELDTVAFVLCTLPTFFFWLEKPLDASTTVSIFLKEGVTIRDILLSAGKEAEKPFRFTPLDFLAPEADPYELLDSVLHGMELLFGIGGNPKHGPIRTFRASSTNLTPRHTRPVDFIFITTVVYCYLGIHFIAWNFTFPTPVERTLWRAAVCLLVTAPITYMLFFLMGNLRPRWFGAIVGVKDGKSTFEVWKQARPLTQYVLCTLFIGCYGVARLFVLVEAMVGLRAMERNMFRTVEWSEFFPHV